MRDTFGLFCEEPTRVPAVVPMFHACAWGLPYCARGATGAKLIFPGPHLDPVSLLDLMQSRARQLAARRAHHLDRHPGAASIAIPQVRDLPAMRTMLIGGSAAPAVDDRRLQARADHHLGHGHARLGA